MKFFTRVGKVAVYSTKSGPKVSYPKPTKAPKTAKKR